jgi:signal transduction histidine kinase
MADERQPDEEQLRRSVALQNARSILLARRRAEQDLLSAKEALELKTRELARSLALMGATLEATWDGILVTDETGRVTAFNERFAEMWRLPRDVAAAMDRIPDYLAGQVADRRAYLEQIADIHTSAPAESHGVLNLEDGRVFEGFSRIQVVDGRSVGRVWTFRDITEHRRAEQAARQAAEERRQLLESEQFARGEAERANAMKDEFLATVSHELRTPLNAILGWSHLLRTGAMTAAQNQQGLEVIERNARAQIQLIEDLLDMSRIISGKMRLDIQSVDPAAFIEAAIETVKPAAEAKGIRLSPLLDPGAGPVNGDPGRLQQVVWNLLSNAIKFTARDGRIQVVLERVNSHVEIAVADTGVGIKPEFLPHVFDRFRQEKGARTRSATGLGLGLSIVKHLVELHGGSVRAVSAGEGQGATFTVCLPLTVVQREGGRGGLAALPAPGPVRHQGAGGGRSARRARHGQARPGGLRGRRGDRRLRRGGAPRGGGCAAGRPRERYRHARRGRVRALATDPGPRPVARRPPARDRADRLRALRGPDPRAAGRLPGPRREAGRARRAPGDGRQRGGPGRRPARRLIYVWSRTCRRTTPQSAIGSSGFSRSSAKPSARSSSRRPR